MSKKSKVEKSSNQTVMWKQAAVFGALWGVIEITIGSFLHATRLPSGIFLASTGIALLTATQMLTGKPWMAFRIALVCAGVRALTPHGLMLGPMASILLQGLFVSVAWILFRNSILTGIVAGAFATISTQLQSFVVKLFAYGVELLEIYLQLLGKAESFFRLEHGQGWIVIIFYFAFVASIGIIGGIIGHRIGWLALQMISERSKSGATPE
jgi:hypothetical protein